MRLVRFVPLGKEAEGPRIGVQSAVDGDVVDITGLLPESAREMVGLVAAWGSLGGPAGVSELVARGASVPAGALRLLAPILPVGNVIAVGRNYRDHAAEFSSSGFDASEKQVIPDHPVVFTKATSSVVGPGDPIVLANDPSGTTDYEGELGVVIGRTARGVAREDALDHVFGWTLINDVTARELQKQHVQWFIGKSPDTFCPIGPSIVTRDELPDVGDLRIRTRVNGDLRQDMATSAMIFDVPHLIETLSRVMTLRPGDVIATGTGLGVGIGMDPPVYLRTGDVVEVEADHIGVLRSPVV